MLDIDKIAKLLEKNGCSKTHTIKKADEYAHPDLDQFLYINRESGRAPSGLIIHPIYLSRLKVLKDIPGVNNNKSYSYKSSLKTFPKTKNKGEDIHYGIPFGFDNEEAFNVFFNKLKLDEFNELDEAETKVALSDSVTEKKALIDARLGHGKYKRQLVKLWGQCSVTECVYAPFLKASHIQPWNDSNNIERLDPFNGLLLIPNLDTAFDLGFITFEDNGTIKISKHLDLDTQKKLGIKDTYKILDIKEENKKYLAFHRNNVFEKFIK